MSVRKWQMSVRKWQSPFANSFLENKNLPIMTQEKGIIVTNDRKNLVSANLGLTVRERGLTMCEMALTMRVW